ncbi:hypothetical protein DFP72DRAFT_1060752 [Ephemerocybe angulata]|uniref:Uncharacterized protein n=1 Tax=Ephemerocybe angulata TaxID=980116 RepID=A0A8H6ICD9_9AGAR|nr:hypothetical protein DFP72DRAFT_1060752 [Tulosesus angulatus]
MDELTTHQYDPLPFLLPSIVSLPSSLPVKLQISKAPLAGRQLMSRYPSFSLHLTTVEGTEILRLDDWNAAISRAIHLDLPPSFRASLVAGTATSVLTSSPSPSSASGPRAGVALSSRRPSDRLMRTIDMRYEAVYQPPLGHSEGSKKDSCSAAGACAGQESAGCPFGSSVPWIVRLLNRILRVLMALLRKVRSAGASWV